MHTRPSIARPRLDILQFLEMRWDASAAALQSFIVSFDEIATALDLAPEELRDHLAILDGEGYLKAVHLTQWLTASRRHRRSARRAFRSRLVTDEADPDYFITALGHVIVALVKQWATALQDAEAIQVLLTPTYHRHSPEELRTIAADAVTAGRDPHEVVAELLAEGAETDLPQAL